MFVCCSPINYTKPGNTIKEWNGNANWLMYQTMCYFQQHHGTQRNFSTSSRYALLFFCMFYHHPARYLPSLSNICLPYSCKYLCENLNPDILLLTSCWPSSCQPSGRQPLHRFWHSLPLLPQPHAILHHHNSVHRALQVKTVYVSELTVEQNPVPNLLV